MRGGKLVFLSYTLHLCCNYQLNIEMVTLNSKTSKNQHFHEIKLQAPWEDFYYHIPLPYNTQWCYNIGFIYIISIKNITYRKNYELWWIFHKPYKFKNPDCLQWQLIHDSLSKLLSLLTQVKLSPSYSQKIIKLDKTGTGLAYLYSCHLGLEIIANSYMFMDYDHNTYALNPWIINISDPMEPHRAMCVGQ